ncbi:glyoxalase/bleomycin resistance/extradiol dioxygenase family protein [Siphonobacter sp. BAB-5405]|uniref:VOC family protein n=1 Tax=Siphonobacter sp. BAB-5405 TaxID=1864825 RepID=UPI000C80F687|nr:VOC family protein [Siphonobacter sp. BAB-5405]PMD92394.1 glyoxalase/bleomycin resistance/extradiol dioxygenase family protein [Siphonobacter sp. BAB-5405]
MASPLLGLRTTIYAAPDLEQTKAWYTDFLGIAPYFDEPFYVGYNVGGYELGLDPHLAPAKGSPVTYWGVEHINEVYQSLLEKGAKSLEEPQEVGGGIFVATLQDPFGNTLGIIYNPHFRVE